MEERAAGGHGRQDLELNRTASASLLEAWTRQLQAPPSTGICSCTRSFQKANQGQTCLRWRSGGSKIVFMVIFFHPVPYIQNTLMAKIQLQNVSLHRVVLAPCSCSSICSGHEESDVRKQKKREPEGRDA